MAAVDAVEQRVGFPDGSRVISLAAERARRRAHRPPLPADRLRDDDHDLPRPAPGSASTCRRCKPTWFFAVPRVWEKLKAGVEAKLGGDEDALALLAARARGAVELEQAGEPIPAELQPRSTVAEAKLFAPLRGRARARRGRSWSTSAPRRRRARCSCSSTPSASRWPRSGGCRRPAARRVEPRRADQDRHRRARRRRASSSSSPRTASC